MTVRVREDLAERLKEEGEKKGFSTLGSYVNEILRRHLFEVQPPWEWVRRRFVRSLEEDPDRVWKLEITGLASMAAFAEQVNWARYGVGDMGNNVPDRRHLIGKITEVDECYLQVESVSRGAWLGTQHEVPLADVVGWTAVCPTPEDKAFAERVNAFLDRRPSLLFDDGSRLRLERPYTPIHAACLRMMPFGSSTFYGPKCWDVPAEFRVDELMSVPESDLVKIPLSPFGPGSDRFSASPDAGADLVRIMGVEIRSSSSFKITSFCIGGSPEFLHGSVDEHRLFEPDVLHRIRALRCYPILIHPNSVHVDFDRPLPDVTLHVLVHPMGEVSASGSDQIHQI